ncbi:MAG: SWIM zinc finger family protein [Corynebacterium sp.]|nr:SWIM zinc finger family protein [Corynebacterium sp.]
MSPRGVRGSGEQNNVTYVNFGAKKKVFSPNKTEKIEASTHRHSARDRGLSRKPRPANSQQKPLKQLGNGKEDIASTFRGRAAAWLEDFIKSEADPVRLSRGRAYAQLGHVVQLDFRNGAIHGLVAGSQNYPFKVVIELPFINKEVLTELGTRIVETPNFFTKISAGHFTDDMLEILLGNGIEDYRLRCSCPDSAWICKHIVAVMDRASARIDADPLELLRLRGLDLRKLNEIVAAVSTDESDNQGREHLKKSQASVSALPVPGEQEEHASSTDDSAQLKLAAAQHNELFWQGRELPDLPTPKHAPAIDDSDPKLLQKAMKAVSHTNIDMLRAVSDVEDLYYLLTEEGLDSPK